MSRAVRLGGLVLAVVAGVVLAVLARDGACLATNPPQCSRSFGVPSGIYLALGLLVGLARLFLTGRRGAGRSR